MGIAQAFAVTQVMFSLEEPIRWIPQFIGVFTEFLISMRRIQNYLLCDEINPNLIQFQSEELKKKKVDILIENASFTWAGNQEKEKKKDIKDKKSNEESKIGMKIN